MLEVIITTAVKIKQNFYALFQEMCLIHKNREQQEINQVIRQRYWHKKKKDVIKIIYNFGITVCGTFKYQTKWPQKLITQKQWNSTFVSLSHHYWHSGCNNPLKVVITNSTFQEKTREQGTTSLYTKTIYVNNCCVHTCCCLETTPIW